MPDVNLSLAERSFHEFLRTAKVAWSKEMFGAVRREFTARGLDKKDVDEAERTMRDSTTYQFYGWFERNLQNEKYGGTRGIINTVDARRGELQRKLDDAAKEGQAKGLLRLDPSLKLPDYYAKTEFHQHPGGVWSDDLAGFAYEIGRQTTMPMTVSPHDMHQRVVRQVPAGKYRRILDIGCGTGWSTLAFAERFPDAEIYGIDLSAPCLKLAYRNARDRGVPVKWSQQMGEATDFPDGHFDLIHSTFLLHEMPPKAVAALTKEAARLLAPGGVYVHLDFHSPPGGTFGQFIHYGHSRRNEEHFMRSFCETDFLKQERDAGFTEARMEPFDDGTGLPAADGSTKAWRFPFQFLVAKKAA